MRTHSPYNVKLQPYLRLNLDILFVALNPPVQSNTNGHYFSGSQSRFYKLLYQSGLIDDDVPKSNADEIVFGSTHINYRHSEFGIIDLVDDIVQTNSKHIKPSSQHVDRLIANIYKYHPRFVCIIHSKVRDAVNRHAGFSSKLEYGVCGPLLPGASSRFVLNYFPNGNAIVDEDKVVIFRMLREML